MDVDEVFDELQTVRGELTKAMARIQALELGLHNAYPWVAHTAAVERDKNMGYLASGCLKEMRKLLALEGKPL